MQRLSMPLSMFTKLPPFAVIIKYTKKFKMFHIIQHFFTTKKFYLGKNKYVN
jgi:hypothetical protein